MLHPDILSGRVVGRAQKMRTKDLSAAKIRSVEHPTPGYHTSLHSIILFPKIAPGAAWPPINFNGLKKQSLNRVRPFIVAAHEIYHEPRMAIDTAVHVEAPRVEFFVAIHVPESIRSADSVHPTLHTTVPTDSK
jgi:hypothetical protein